MRHYLPLVLLICIYPFSSAQTASQSGDGCLHRTLLVSVSDKSGPVMNLDKGNFLLEAKSVPLTVLSAKPRRQPARTLLLIDVSGSMTGSPGKLPLMAALARGFVDAASPQAPLALMTFNDKVKEQLDFSTPHAVIIGKLEQLSRESPQSPSGRTALFDALVIAADMFRSSQISDGVIFLISDGGDTSSHTRASTAKKLLLENGVRLFAFAPVEDLFPPRKSGSDRARCHL